MGNQLKILLVWHAAVVKEYHTRFQEIVNQGNCILYVLTPRFWKEGARVVKIEENFRGVNNNVHLLVGESFLNFHGSTFFYRPSYVREIIKQLQPDIIHIHEEPWSLCAFQIITLAKRWSPKSRIIFESWQNIFKKLPWPFSLIETFTFNTVDGAIAGSNEIKSVLKRKGFSKKIEVIPLGTDEKIYNPLIISKREELNLKDEFVIGFVGRLEKQKGVHVLIDALAHLKKYNFRLLIIGDGTYKLDLLDRVKRYQLSDKVNFLGAIPHKEIPSYMNTFDVLVLPSITTKNWKEQFGRVLVEAMLCKKVVIGSDSGEIPFVIGNTGIIFEENNPYALKDALLRLIKNPLLYKHLSIQGYNRAKDLYTWKAVCKKNIDFYKNLLA